MALDFSKAFDLVPHTILIEKLIKYNIDPVLVRWIHALVSGRSQRVVLVLNGCMSKSVPVTSGVPQGSVLGPVLFLVFINDIVDVVRHCTIKLYADDTLLYMPITSTEDCDLLQQDLDALHDWSKQNHMRFNACKSYFTVFSTGKCRYNEPNYHIGGASIQSTRSIKYLGVLLQGDLHWDGHISSVVSRASRVLGLMRSVLYDAPPKVKMVAYVTLCRPILEYASAVWDPYVKKLTYDLEIIQNKAIRFIFSVKGRDTSISTIKESNNISTLQDRRKSHRICMLLNILENENLHPSLSDVLTEMLSKSHMCTRNRSFNSIYCRTNIFLNSFLPRTARDLRAGEEGAERSD